MKSNNSLKIIIATVVCVLLVVALVLTVLIGSNVISFNLPASGTEDSTQDTQDTQEDTLPPNLVSYSAADEAAAQASTGNIVATAGSKQLTNAELQTYYWVSFYNFLNENYYYLSYYGLDITQPLDQQIYDATDNTTWQQAFLDSALQVWHRYTALALVAEDSGFTLSDADQATVDNLAQNARDIAASNGYASVEDFLTTEMGPAATLDGYVAYQTTYYYTMRYVDSIYDSLLPAADEIEAYYTENEASFVSGGVSKEDGDVVDVRHILIIPEGGTTDENGNTTYSEDDYAACYDVAKAILDQWKAGDANEDSFAALATEHSEDPGSASNGGLYSGVTQGYMVEEFDSWIFDESRQYGDTELVKTDFGYHIMYFVSRDAAWEKTAISLLTSEKLNEKIDTAMATWPMEINYDQIVIGSADLGISEE